jgi:hypothetical protein
MAKSDNGVELLQCRPQVSLALNPGHEALLQKKRARRPRSRDERPYGEVAGGAPSSSRFKRHRHDAPAQYDFGKTLYPDPLSCDSGDGSCLVTGAGAGGGGDDDAAGVGAGGSTGGNTDAGGNTVGGAGGGTLAVSPAVT